MKADLIEHVIRPTLPEQFATTTSRCWSTPPARSSSAARTPTAASPGARSSSTPTAAWPATAAARSAARTPPRSTGRPPTRCATSRRTSWPRASRPAARCRSRTRSASRTPISMMVETFGTSEIDPQKLPDLLREHFDLRPAAIIERLDLRRPIFRNTAAYGHFGRSDRDFTWERTDARRRARQRPRRRSRKRARRSRASNTRVCRVQPDVPAIHRAFDYVLPDALARERARRHDRAGAAPRSSCARAGCSMPTSARPRSTGARLREVLAVVSAGPPPTSSTCAAGARGDGRVRWPRSCAPRRPPNSCRGRRRARARDRGVPAVARGRRRAADDRCSRPRRGARRVARWSRPRVRAS